MSKHKKVYNDFKDLKVLLVSKEDNKEEEVVNSNLTEKESKMNNEVEVKEVKVEVQEVDNDSSFLGKAAKVTLGVAAVAGIAALGYFAYKKFKE